jgi:hypothetical protein
MVLRLNDYSVIPDHLMNQMILYLEESKTPCSFLVAMMSNDFMKTIAKADEDNINILPTYAHFIHWEAPMGSHGSYEKVEAWLNKTGGSGRGLKEKYWRAE